MNSESSLSQLGIVTRSKFLLNCTSFSPWLFFLARKS